MNRLCLASFLLTVAPLSAWEAADGAPESAAPADPGPVEVGGKAPDFELTDTQGKVHKLSDYTAKEKTVVLEWFNPDCPFVRKHHEKTRSMADTRAFAATQGAVWLSINSAAPGKQGYGVERNAKAIADYKIENPVLLDASGAVGKAYGAKTTPHMFVIRNGVVVYAGAIDDRPDASELGKTNYVRQALARLKAGKPVDPAQTKSYGCSVKYAS